MRRQRRNRAGVWLTLAGLCGGGLLPGTCLLRTRQAAIDGTKAFVASALLDPSLISNLPLDNLVGGLGAGQ
ncbi:MAG: hypothetical protein ACE5GE_00720 [Phycisphaerae bacterium]